MGEEDNIEEQAAEQTVSSEENEQILSSADNLRVLENIDVNDSAPNPDGKPYIAMVDPKLCGNEGSMLPFAVEEVSGPGLGTPPETPPIWTGPLAPVPWRK